MTKYNYFLTNPNFASPKRYKIFQILIFLFAIIFIFRLAHLQIIKGSVYRLASEAQAIKEEVVEPFRGNIYDRNNKLILFNEPSFSITITYKEFEKNYPKQLIYLSNILQMDTTSLSRLIRNKCKKDLFVPVKIIRDVSYDIVAKIEEDNEILPGVGIAVESKRCYANNVNLSHLLGYVNEIDANELEAIKNKILKELDSTEDKIITKKQLAERMYYRSGDVIGKMGIEKFYEEKLRGDKGIKYIAVNRFGQKIASFNNGKNDILVRNGYDLYLSIDLRLQELGEKLLEGKRGAIVAMDPRNGEILALVSKPDFDLKKFSGKVDQSYYISLINDPESPMLNRAIAGKYPPGSTWKMLVALAGLQEKIIDENTIIGCPGSFVFGNKTFGDHGVAHGNVNVRRAIQASCNVFFYKLALKVGLEKMTKYAKMFNFGERTGVDISNESKAFFPTYDYVRKKFGVGAIPGQLVNIGIGQGQIEVTPLQMAAYVSAIATKGIYNQPHVVRYWYNNETKKYDTFKVQQKLLPIDKKNFEIIHQGMYDAVQVPGGTALVAQVENIKVCGKTGTAQNPRGRDHSWFVCFAPMENPTIAIAVIVENAGFGAAVAAPIARDILKAYFYPNKSILELLNISLTTDSTKPKIH